MIWMEWKMQNILMKMVILFLLSRLLKFLNNKKCKCNKDIKMIGMILNKKKKMKIIKKLKVSQIIHHFLKENKRDMNNSNLKMMMKMMKNFNIQISMVILLIQNKLKRWSNNIKNNKKRKDLRKIKWLHHLL